MIDPTMLGERNWRLVRSTGDTVRPEISFQADGRIDPVGGDPATWRMEGGNLLLLDRDGRVAMRFTRLQSAAGSTVRLCGATAGDPNLLIYYFLDPVASDVPPKESRLNINASLSAETDTLLVVFNSAGRFSQGLETRWEFHDLPVKLGLDHVRIAETRAPTLYYLDKIDQLRRFLAGLIERRYQHVLLAGMSSGGFASLVLGELLAVALPDVLFETFSINPQTAHSRRHRQFIAEHVPLGFGPELLEDRAVALSDLSEPDVAALVRLGADRRGNVRHHIYFDSRNIAEGYYISLVADLPGFDLHPIPLGLDHMNSAITIFNKHVVQDDIGRAVSLSRG